MHIYLYIHIIRSYNFLEPISFVFVDKTEKNVTGVFFQVPLQSTMIRKNTSNPEVWWVSQNWFLCAMVSVTEKKRPRSGRVPASCKEGPTPSCRVTTPFIIGLFLTPATHWFSAIKTGGPIRLITMVGATYVGSNNSLNAWPKAWVPRVLRWWGSPWMGWVDTPKGGLFRKQIYPQTSQTILNSGLGCTICTECWRKQTPGHLAFWEICWGADGCHFCFGICIAWTKINDNCI